MPVHLRAISDVSPGASKLFLLFADEQRFWNLCGWAGGSLVLWSLHAVSSYASLSNWVQESVLGPGERGVSKKETQGLPWRSFHSRRPSHFHANKCEGVCSGGEIHRRGHLTGKF